MLQSKNNLIHILKNGGIAVMPTDTLYGVVGGALDEKVVEKIYKVRKRTPSKPFIILISSKKDLGKFGIKPTQYEEFILQENWPGPVSIILNCEDDKFEYLHRGTKTLAFRVPNDPSLREFLEKVGPIVAPSANPEGMEPAKTLKEAREYFGDKVDTYVSLKDSDDPFLGKPSKIIKIENDGSISILRS